MSEDFIKYSLFIPWWVLAFGCSTSEDISITVQMWPEACKLSDCSDGRQKETSLAGQRESQNLFLCSGDGEAMN